MQISPSLSDLGELQERCCREWNVPLHLAQFICLGCTHGMDHDTKRLTDVLAGTQEGPNQEHLIWLLWVGSNKSMFVNASWWGGFGFIYHEDVGTKRAHGPELSIMPMSGFMALVASLNATWMQFFADCDSHFREILVACESVACGARMARCLRHSPPGCWKKVKTIPLGLLKDYPHSHPPPPDHQP